MKFGLSPDQYSYIQKTVVTPLQQKGARVFCFGSRARGVQHKFSDLDLMVETPVGLELNLGAIREELEKSNFPFKVDLVLFSEFSESYKSNYQAEKKLFLNKKEFLLNSKKNRRKK